jgi:hypothetical protein
MDDKSINLWRQIEACRSREKARRKTMRRAAAQAPILS